MLQFFVAVGSWYVFVFTLLQFVVAVGMFSFSLCWSLFSLTKNLFSQNLCHLTKIMAVS